MAPSVLPLPPPPAIGDIAHNDKGHEHQVKDPLVEALGGFLPQLKRRFGTYRTLGQGREAGEQHKGQAGEYAGKRIHQCRKGKSAAILENNCLTEINEVFLAGNRDMPLFCLKMGL